VSNVVQGRRVLLSNVPAEIWARCKAEAALAGQTLNDWVIDALVRKLEDAIDIREGLQSLQEPGQSISWDEVKREVLGQRSGV